VKHQDQDRAVYMVVVNDEEQYSLWPVERPVPAGWRQVGAVGRMHECLDYIDAVWSDMHPLSLRPRSGGPPC
jgi:MbtH protein